MIRAWFARRRAARTARSREQTRGLLEVIETEILPQLAAQGFQESPFLPAPRNGRLPWDPNNRVWETQLARPDGAQLETLWLALHPDHSRGSQVFLQYDRVTSEPPLADLRPGSLPYGSLPDGPYKPTQVDHRQALRRPLKLVLKPRRPVAAEIERLRARTLATLDNLPEIRSYWIAHHAPSTIPTQPQPGSAP